MEKVLFTILLVILTVNSGAAQDIQDPQIEARMNEAMARAKSPCGRKKQSSYCSAMHGGRVQMGSHGRI